MDFKDLKAAISDDILTEFCESLHNTSSQCVYTIDYYDNKTGKLPDKSNPNGLNFCVALLREILCNLKPSHELWDKIKYAAFLLNLVSPDNDFAVLYQIYHQVERDITENNLSWRDKEIRTSIGEKIAENVSMMNTREEDDYEVTLDDITFSDDEVEPDPTQDNYAEIDFSSFDTFQTPPQAPPVPDTTTMTTRSRRVKKEKNEKKEKKVKKEPKLVKPKLEKKKDWIYDEQESNDVKDPSWFPGQNEKEELEDIKEGQNGWGGGEEHLPPPEEEEDNSWVNNIIRDRKQLPKRARKPNNKFFPDDGPEKKKIKRTKFRCTEMDCSYWAYAQPQLDRHGFETHKSSKLCTQCGHLSDTYEDFVAHNNTHVYTCEICNSKYLGARSLKAHMVRAHPEDKEKVPCDICGKMVHAYGLSMHKENSHSTDVHQCDRCDYATNSKYKYKIHYKRHFMSTKECTECGKAVKDLKKHFRDFCNRNPARGRFPCTICEKSFGFKETLEKHVENVHLKVNTFSCDLCEYKTHHNPNLRKHMRKMHTRDGFHRRCPHCNKIAANLEFHIQTIHPEIHAAKIVNHEV